MKDCIVIGVGNILFKDEGIGVYAAKYLERNYAFTPEVEIIDGATLGFRLMTYFQEYKRVYIIDTISIKDEPGSIYKVPADELLGLGTYRQTAHEVEIVEMLEICSLLESIAEVSVFGIVPEDIASVEISLTEAMVKNFDALNEQVLAELKNIGYTYEKKNDISLDGIIEELQNSVRG